MEATKRFFVITGGPGSGKSTLLSELKAHGVPHMPEAGRTIIRDQMAIGGTALPWVDIFRQDDERRQSLAEAEATHEAMARVYTRQGYDLAPLPRASVQDRARFILDRIG